MQEGFIIINKPRGITSFGIVAQLRKITGIKKIGHCGTLDPLATGVLICAIGRSATKSISKLIKANKEYIATIELGKESSTYDAEGEIHDKKIKSFPTKKQVALKLKNFIGEIKQIPPIYSAKKIKGERAYSLARKGEEVALEPVKINIDKIKIISYKVPFLKIRIQCGSGTYIRSLANDIGKELKTGAYLAQLIREKVGDYNIKSAQDIEKINTNNWTKHIFNLSEKEKYSPKINFYKKYLQ